MTPPTQDRAPRAEPAEAPYAEQVRELLFRAQQGDQRVLPQLREVPDSRPELWRQMGDLAGHARDALLALASGPSLLARESIRRRMQEVQAELAGPAPSPLESLLAERAALCWGQSYLADVCALAKQRAGGPEAAQADRRAAVCQARYLAALRQLALVRKLLRPAPTPLELLRGPVGETAGDGGDRQARGGVPRAACAAQ